MVDLQIIIINIIVIINIAYIAECSAIDGSRRQNKLFGKNKKQIKSKKWKIAPKDNRIAYI